MSKWRTKLFRILALALILALTLPVIPAQAAKWDTSRVSVATGGAQSNGASYRASISPDGNFVVFYSYATNLVGTDTNGKADIFMRNVTTNETILISVATDGTQGNNSSLTASVASGGRYVAFDSTASNLVANDTNGVSDVFVRDTLLNTTIRVSVDSNGVEGNLASSYPVISSDGRYVAFESNATNLDLVTADTNGRTDIFVHDLQTHTTMRISLSTGGAQGDDNSTSASISSDGRYVAFESLATNLVAGDTNSTQDIFLRDTQTNTTTRISVDTAGGDGNGMSRHPDISSDGRYVAFDSFASDLVASDLNGATGDIFVRDTQTNTTSLLSLTSDGNQATILSSYPSISSDGRYVAFMTSAILIYGDKNGVNDIFVRDTFSNTTTRVSIASDGTQGNDASTYPSMSDNGEYVVFLSTASTLVSGDTNGVQDVFLHQRGGIYITASDTNPTNAATVHYTVTFDEDVTGVDVADFTLSSPIGNLEGMSVTDVSGSGAVYTVTVDTGGGSGLLRLDILDTATILDEFGSPIWGLPYTRGEMYEIHRETFADVPFTHSAFTWIERLYDAGITSGCGGGNYCPNNPVTRAQMAVFLLRGMNGSAYTPPPATGTIFADVTDTGWFFSAWIEDLYNEGVTGGCGSSPLIYCPNNPVTRAQMAVFLLRGEHGSAYIPPDGTGTIFADVTDPNWFFTDWIEQLYTEGVTGGCGTNPLVYCPYNSVTRAQMAIFLVRAFNLP